MGNFGQIKKLSHLPSDKLLLQYIKEAMKLNETGVKIIRKPLATAGKTLKIPECFKKALGQNKSASKTFEGFSYSNKKEYVEWVTEAKTEETRNKRMAISIGWMAQGKTRNWKYERK